MAKIIDLPVEIIRMIALMVLPEDFENFAGASKHVASVTQDLLEKHRLLVKNYLHRGSDRDGTWYMIPELLEEILTNPRIGHYIRDFKVGHPADFHLGEDHEQDFELLHKTLEGHERQVPLPETVTDLKWWRDKWWHTAIPAEKAVRLPFILAFLPNLSTLHIELVLDTTKDDIINLFTHIARSGDSPFLGKLKDFRLQDSTTNFSYDLDIVNAVSAFPSLQRLSASGLIELGGTSEKLAAFRKSHVTDLDLSYCHLNPASIQTFLSRFETLKIFEYSCAPPGSTIAIDFDQSALLTTLLAVAKSTLKKLVIRSYYGISGYMGSMHDFKALEEVYANWSFFRPVKEPCMLSALLPATVRRLAVDANSCTFAFDWRQLIECAVRCKMNGTLPYLMELTIYGIFDHWDLPPANWGKKCKRAGIKLHSPPGNCPYQF